MRASGEEKGEGRVVLASPRILQYTSRTVWLGNG